MKLADRTFMNQTRYSQSFGDFSRKNKLLSTGFTPSLMATTSRLPKLSRSLSSSSTKSTLSRLQMLQQSATHLKSQISQLRLETRESRRFVNFMKDDLGDKELNQFKGILALQVKKLDNGFRFQRKQNQDRTLVLKRDAQELTQNSRKIVGFVDDLKARLDSLEDAMGIYSAKEKHKF